MSEIEYHEGDPYPKSFIGRASRAFWDYVGDLTGSGTFKVKGIQQQLIDALLPALEPHIRTSVEMQLAQPYYMQFWHGGRVCPFFFDDFNLPRELRIPDPNFLDRLYKVEMFVEGRKQQAHVTFYNGRIHCLEFKRPLKFYRNRDIRFGKAVAGTPSQSITRAIDRSEHGRAREESSS